MPIPIDAEMADLDHIFDEIRSGLCRARITG